MKTSIEKLTELQLKVGYKFGRPNAIALLGLFGEAGEVLNEVFLTCEEEGFWNKYPDLLRRNSVSYARLVDELKKEIRDNKRPVLVNFESTYNADEFNRELADVLYYLNALAISQGKTLEDYAEMSYQKAIVALDKAIRNSSERGVKQPIYLHDSLKPLDLVELKENQTQLFNECEGNCDI